MDNTENITVLSLCTGYGGLELGLSRALARSLRVVAVEIEAYALANLVSKAEESKLAIEALYPDVRTFPAERFSGCFDIIAAGYPCQPFSNAGKRKGTEDPRHLWPHIERIVQAVRPLWCFFENVSGHLTLGFPEVYQSLRLMGYKVEAGLFTAAEVGAPHKRERLFILAHSRCNKQTGVGGNRKTQDGKAQSRRSSNRRNPQSLSSGNGELGDPRGTEPRGLPDNERQGISSAGETGEKLADTEDTERGWVSEKHAGRRASEVGGSNGMWPARPGQEQYDWEEPRTIEPGMGQTVDGFASRVDELRLLGNGVVPEQAEKAFRELIGLFE